MRGLRRLGPGRYTITSLRQRLLEEGRGCFYAAEPDFDSETDSYDPTRECYHAVGPLQHGKTPGRLGTTDKSTPLHKKTGLRSLHSYGSSR